MQSKEITNKNKVVVLTGGTGGFGRFLALELLRYKEVKLILLIRENSLEEAQESAKEVLGESYSEQIEIFCSDLTKERLGLSEQEYTNLANRATHILHAAASVRFTLPLEEARQYNVKTTENTLNFAKMCPNLARFGFVSTALISGNRSGTIKEDEFEHNAGFKNTYEQTKYEAEKLVRGNSEKLPVVVFRPPLIATESTTGNNLGSRTNALSLGIRLVIGRDISFLPGNDNSTVDIVSSKTAANRIVTLILKPSLMYLVYQITNDISAPTIKIIREIIEKKISHPISLEFCGSMDVYNKKVRSISWYKFRAKRAHEKISSFVSELAYPKIYNNAHTLKELQISHLGDNPIDIVKKIVNEKTWSFSV